MATEVIAFRVRVTEKEKLAEMAAAKGERVSDYVRSVVRRFIEEPLPAAGAAIRAEDAQVMAKRSDSATALPSAVDEAGDGHSQKPCFFDRAEQLLLW